MEEDHRWERKAKREEVRRKVKEEEEDQSPKTEDEEEKSEETEESKQAAEDDAAQASETKTDGDLTPQDQVLLVFDNANEGYDRYGYQRQVRYQGKN